MKHPSGMRHFLCRKQRVQGGQPHQHINSARYCTHLTKQRGDEIETEQSDKPPIQPTDDEQQRRNPVQRAPSFRTMPSRCGAPLGNMPPLIYMSINCRCHDCLLCVCPGHGYRARSEYLARRIVFGCGTLTWTIRQRLGSKIFYFVLDKKEPRMFLTSRRCCI